MGPHAAVALMDKITKTQNEVIMFFGQLVEANSRLKGITKHQSPELEAQMQQLLLMKQQLDAQKKRISEMRNTNINNLRLTQNNYYNNNLYLAYQDIFKFLLIMAAVILFIAALRQSNMLSSNNANILAGITIVIISGIIIYKSYNLYRRDNMVFTEFNFGPPDARKKHTTDESGDDFASSINLVDMLRDEEEKLAAIANGECIGAACCDPDGLHYSKHAKSCETGGKKGKKDSNKETFISGCSGGGGGYEIAPESPIMGSIDSNFYSLN